VPRAGDLNVAGISVSPETMDALLEIDVEAWREELAAIGEYLESYGERTPAALHAEQERVRQALDLA
jgi:phosphoenolpyruvate carboxykinase (GTP)